MFSSLFRTYKTYEEVVADFEAGALHPGDLKPALGRALNKIIEPVQTHFKTDPYAKQVKQKSILQLTKLLIFFYSTQLLEKVQQYMSEVYGTK